VTAGATQGAPPPGAAPLDAWPALALVVFDADDTLRTTLVPGQPCPRAPGEWALLPGVRETLGGVPWGAPGAPALALASNQDQVAYGHLTLAASRRLLADCARAATGGYAPPDALLQLCPHALDVACDCRKPAPGMLVAAMGHAGAAPRDTLFVGNAESDREAARRAGVRFAWAWDVFGWGGPVAAPWVAAPAPSALHTHR
jgi:D-glycero-D-manno-heptose 1,7-bisphosphate phosphatase